MSLKLLLVILLSLSLSLSKQNCRIGHGLKLAQVICWNVDLHSDRKLTIPNKANLEKLVIKNVSGKLDLANFTLNKLRYIVIAHSEIDTVVLGNFPKLIFLTFLKNQKVPNVTKNLFSSATHIQWLSLIGNNQTIEPQGFQFLQNLTWLHIQNQNLKALTSEFFKHNSKLHELTIRNCNLATISSNTFDRTPNLEILSFNFNKIRYFENGTFKNLQNLKILELHHNTFINLDLNQFRGLESVEILGLPSVFLRHVESHELLEVFPNLTKVEIKKKDLIRNDKTKRLVTQLRVLGVQIIGTPFDCHSKVICPIT